MEQPLVSVIVVSYNHSKYIRENLDSIKAQTYPNIELIIADDASKDNSVEVFEAWLSENNYSAKKNFHKQNTGFTTTLNECLEMVTGKYVKIIAADDYLHPESIEKCVNVISKSDNIGFVFSDMYYVDNNSQFLEKNLFSSEIYHDSPERLKDALFNKCIVCAPSVLISYQALKSTGKYDPSKIVEDYDRWLKIVTSGYELRCIPEKLVYYRFHGESITFNSNGKIQEEAFILYFKYSNQYLFLNSEIEKIFLKGYRYNQDFFDSYKNYKYKDTLTYLFIKNNQPTLLRMYRIIKQKLNIKN